MQGAMMQGHPAMSGHPAMQQGMGNRPPPPEYGMSSQNQNMPFMMSQHGMHPGMNPNMRMPGGPGGMMPGRGPGSLPVRNPGMQQIPPSGPMMRQQNPLGDRMRQPGQMPSNMNPNMMAMMGGMKPGMVGANNGTMSRSPNPMSQAWQGGQQSMGPGGMSDPRGMGGPGGMSDPRGMGGPGAMSGP